MSIDDQLCADTVVSEPTSELDALAAELRRLVDLLLRTDDDDPALPGLCAVLAGLVDELEDEIPVGTVPFAKMRRSAVPRHDPVSGIENALAIPLAVAGDDDGDVDGTTSYTLRHQGPEGLVHGGISALVLDHVLSQAHQTEVAGVPIGPLVTAGRTIRYHRPLPMFVEAEIEARQLSVEGRKVRSEGRIAVGGETAVTAEALFVAKPIGAGSDSEMEQQLRTPLDEVRSSARRPQESRT